MKCHYEVLGVTRNATYDDIKAAYRRLALTWHPDKNLSNPDEAKKQFQRIKQAWDVLGDPHERTWYDNHREAILKGTTEDYKDDSINLFSYFTTMCFEGYGDDENGFYTVYRKVFEKLVEEDAEFTRDSESEEEMPGFGNSQSSYEEVVHNFYAYWQSYSTKRSFAWLNPYDLRNAANRRVFRLAEKENRKVRDKARRERNEQVRNLVAFVRKRDKRVQAHAAKLAERARENARKVEERKKVQVLERQKLLRDHTESEWSKFSNIEAELRKIEATLGDDSDDNDMDDNKTLYCIVCNKIFKTHKAYMNHENSRKHKENFSILEASITKDDKQFHSSSSSQEFNSSSTESTAPSKSKLATDSQMPDFLLDSENNTREHDNEEDNEDTSHDELNSGDEKDLKDCQSTTPNEPKLATDSQVPDFLMNPPENDTKEPDNKDNDDTSHDELISDDEENPKDCQSANEKKEINDEDVPLTERSRMNYNCFLCLSESGKEDKAVTSKDELMSDQEAAASSDCQKKKKKNRRRRKKNVLNPNPVPNVNDDDNTESINEDMWFKSKKQRKKLQQRKTAMTKHEKSNTRSRDGEKQEAEGNSKLKTEAKSSNVNETVSSKKKSKKKDEADSKVGNDSTSLDFLQLFMKKKRDNVWRDEDSVYTNMEVVMDFGGLSPPLVQVGPFQ
ncbi:dnaJ homolog subfamily C member 21 [Harpegnathos saltator]|uniref:DnaJ homolog subfamily C member 21 n=1 Tax=Harpegnathos saltator TaxID=610380 RepID=E2B7B3_HARSA|nr:dnaJ homolog subfamily C member 21 [Harpegnathos saltator]XP_019700979.1 dnaJ homolog subfamily C member 21 [Harpegnathos saltator]XP_025155031.1 dnaJ homolog subfamily C member 21 [Harpegnathos saltator]XP_025155032.1 dnaJ homolog subfamily C member 21 [Harpegnathos saltator]EFN88398.1 DnaJ-like protein subfamily C member 21 [Harpegnathos saltator]